MPSAWHNTSGGSGGGYELQLSLPGTSMTGWTTESGTWSSDGTVISKTDTVAGDQSTWYDTPIDYSEIFICQVDIRFPSSGQVAGDYYGGVAFTNGTSAATTNGPRWRMAEVSSAKTRFEILDGTLSVQNTQTISAFSEDVWYTVRMGVSGGVISVRIDDEHICTTRWSDTTDASTATNEHDQVGFIATNGLVDFRNLSVWTMVQP